MDWWAVPYTKPSFEQGYSAFRVGVRRSSVGISSLSHRARAMTLIHLNLLQALDRCIFAPSPELPSSQTSRSTRPKRPFNCSTAESGASGPARPTNFASACFQTRWHQAYRSFQSSNLASCPVPLHIPTLLNVEHRYPLLLTHIL